ncbi:MAG TPA: signal peptidase II [Stellaceae bacterium]|nr:signal peptidase II [Stellaceae bacterium]
MWRRGLAAAVVVALLDQLSKWGVRAYFADSGCVPQRARISSFFDLVITCNRGMSFGLFNDGGGLNALVFSLVAAAIVLLLVFWLSRITSPFLAMAIGLIVGGAAGNVIDRLRFGAVVDFLYFHLGAWYWPAFNFADSAISVGVVAMLIDGLLLHKEAH